MVGLVRRRPPARRSGEAGAQRARGRVALLVVLAGLALACAGAPAEHGVFHPVQPGETIYRIARYYGGSVRSVVRANRIRDVESVPVGTRLWITGSTRRPPGRPLPPPGGERAGAIAKVRNGVERAREHGLAFHWPVRGELTSRYGRRWGRRHEGIDVANRRGTAVRAAEDGQVIYASALGAYGNVVIVRHPGRYETVYAHNRKNRVRKGSRVSKGQVIAELGDTGNATGPHLHFEIRQNDRALDPLQYLP
jgi:murein DD-endopeptidase MepM/ murein hydrolase activator NlpD